MHEWLDSFMILLLYAMTGSQSVNGQVLKQGCIGESIKIKENITYSIDMYISIFKTEGGTMGMWHINASIPLITNGYSKRVVLDRTGNIWITDLVESDSDTYSIRTDIGNLKPNIEKVKLKVLVPPTKNCTPMITRKDNLLITDLRNMNNKECGDPPVEAYWLDHPENSITEKVIKLQPGNDNGIFHACIKGDSLTCTKMSTATEYCSIYIDSTYNFPEKSPETSTTATYTFHPTSFIFIVILAVIISACVICLIFLCVYMKKTLYRKRQKKKQMTSLNDEDGTDSEIQRKANDVSSPGGVGDETFQEETDQFITADDTGSASQTDIDLAVTSTKVPSQGVGDGETVNSGIQQVNVTYYMTDQVVPENVCSDKSIGVESNMFRNGPITLSRSSIMGRPKSLH